MTPYLPELAPWIDEQFKSLPAASKAAPRPCLEPVAPDTSMLRHMQRRIAKQTEALPAKFASRAEWDAYRSSMIAWLKDSCELEGATSSGPPVASSVEIAGGIRCATIELPVESGYTLPATILAPNEKILRRGRR